MSKMISILILTSIFCYYLLGIIQLIKVLATETVPGIYTEYYWFTEEVNKDGFSWDSSTNTLTIFRRK